MKRLLLLLFVLLAPQALAQTVTNLQAQHRNGQTFLTWDNASASGASYRVYRAATPFTQASDLSADKRLGTAAGNSSANTRLSGILNTTSYFRIDESASPLAAQNGLFVHTVMAEGNFYYAVTVVVNNQEVSTLTAGQNTLAAPAPEATGNPAPVLQQTTLQNGRNYEVYAHWVSPAGHAAYPAMTTGASVAFNFALLKRGTAAQHPLLIRLHARGGNFLTGAVGTTNADEWLLSPDDYLPNDIRNTFWYGYHENFDFQTGQGVPSSGVVQDYTVRRIRWLLDWVLRTFPIDRNRVYMTGGSMGGIGSFFLSMMMPDKIAAIYTTVPKFDFSFLTDPNPANIWNAGSPERTAGDRMWGTVATNLPSSEGLPVYDRLNAGVLARRLANTSLPVMIAFNGKNDTIVGWAEKIGFYRAMEESRHGGYFFWDSRTHNGQGAEWQPQQSNSILYRFRLNQSYPAFSRANSNENPGDGHATSGDAVGSINGYLSWDENIVDTADRYEITVRLTDLQSTLGAMRAPDSATVDITPRRLQSLTVAAGQVFNFENRDSTGQVVQQGQITADRLGLLTVPQFRVTRNGARLIITRPSAPSVSTHVSAASFSGASLAGESIVSAFGTRLATATTAATTSPLPTQLAGTTVKVRDSAGAERLAPLFFVSPTQINYQIPAMTAAGAATITTTSGDGSVSSGSAQIAAVAPGLFSAAASGQGLAAAVALRVKDDGTQQFEPVARFDAAQQQFVAIPIDLGPETDQVFLILFGTGIRSRSSLSSVGAKIGGPNGVDGQVTFAGAQGGFVGLDQVNARIARSLAGRGEVDVALTVDGQAANTVRINIK